MTASRNGCDRSNRAYSQILKFAGIPQPVKSFAACSGAVSSEIYSSFSRSTGAQADGGVHPDVGLVTLTIGGNDVLFSDVVRVCFQYTDCTKTPFPSPSPTRGLTFPISQPLATWGVAATEMVSQRLATLYGHLRATYPKARIVAIGYPYLFPSGKAGWWPDDCASILRRYSVSERAHIREFIDQFNDAAYERAVQAGIEFVSATAAWDGHEPCGAKGQWTNSIKPILSFHDPVDGGSFHPNQTGQQQLAALVACYLDTNSQAPNAFQGGASHPFTISGLEKPSQLGLVPAPGSAQAPLHCAGGK